MRPKFRRLNLRPPVRLLGKTQVEAFRLLHTAPSRPIPNTCWDPERTSVVINVWRPPWNLSLCMRLFDDRGKVPVASFLYWPFQGGGLGASCAAFALYRWTRYLFFFGVILMIVWDSGWEVSDLDSFFPLIVHLPFFQFRNFIAFYFPSLVLAWNEYYRL